MAMPEFHLPADAMDEPFTDDQLHAYFDVINDGHAADDVDDDYVEPVTRWRVEDDHAAEWAMRRLAAEQTRIDELQQQADAYKAEIDAWLDRVLAKPRRSAGFFERALIEYQRQRLAADPKAGKLTLPSGDVKTTDRTKTATVKVDDPRSFAMWARENLPGPVLAAVLPNGDPKVLPSKLDAHLVRPVWLDDGDGGGAWAVVTADGETVPGVYAEPGSLTIKVQPS